MVRGAASNRLFVGVPEDSETGTLSPQGLGLSEEKIRVLSV